MAVIAATTTKQQFFGSGKNYKSLQKDECIILLGWGQEMLKYLNFGVIDIS